MSDREIESNFDRTIRGAREAAAAGRIDQWVHEFLNSGIGSNPAMAIGLRQQQRWWIGPVVIRLDSLTRICGPEPEMEYRQAHESWEARVAAIMAIDPDQLAPLILEYRGPGSLRLSDGSHRHEAMRRRGAATVWALIWCNSQADFFDAHPLYVRSAPNDE